MEKTTRISSPYPHILQSSVEGTKRDYKKAGHRIDRVEVISDTDVVIVYVPRNTKGH